MTAAVPTSTVEISVSCREMAPKRKAEGKKAAGARIASPAAKSELPFLKRHVSKKENEVLHALASLICDKSVSTLSMLAANMSALSEEHRRVVGHGQKDLQKFMQKHSDVFSVQANLISVQSSVKQILSGSDPSVVVTENSLQQVGGVVTKVTLEYGFIRTVDDSNVYFSANVFEGGNVHNLEEHLRIGEQVIVDAVKSGPTYAAEWRATKVRKIKKQHSRDSWSEGSSSLDRIIGLGERQFSLESIWSDIDSARVTVSKSSKAPEKALALCVPPAKLSPIDRQIVQFLQHRIQQKNGSLSLQNLTGHLSGLPAHLRKYLSSRLSDLRSYVMRHQQHFSLTSDIVSLGTEVVVPAANDDEDVSERSDTTTTSSSSSTEDTNQILTKTQAHGSVTHVSDSGSGIIQLSTGEHVHFSHLTTFGKTGKVLECGDAVICNASLNKNVSCTWEALTVWQPPSVKTLPHFGGLDSSKCVTGFNGNILRVYSKFGIIRHGATDDENIYFHKDVVSDTDVENLTDVLSAGDEVICDAIEVTNYTCKYRALRVIPLAKDDTFTVVASRRAAKGELSSVVKPIAKPLSSRSAGGIPALSRFPRQNSPDGKFGDAEVYVSDDEWDNFEDTDEGKLVHCCGVIVSLFPTHGFIKRGNLEKDPENVYFNCLNYYTEDGRKVENLCHVLSAGDVVSYDAVRGSDNVSCKWKAETVWKDSLADTIPQDGQELITSREGRVIKIFPSKGVISFGPHPYRDRVFFSKEVFYYDGNRMWNLASVLSAGDTVWFSAAVDVAGQRTKWKATRVWNNDRKIMPNVMQNGYIDDISQDEGSSMRNREGRVKTVFPSKGILTFGCQAFFQEVFFTIDKFFDHGSTVHNLQVSLKENEAVMFDAVIDKPGMRTKWKADLVWRGFRPQVKACAENSFQLRDLLENIIPGLRQHSCDYAKLGAGIERTPRERKGSGDSRKSNDTDRLLSRPTSARSDDGSPLHIGSAVRKSSLVGAANSAANNSVVVGCVVATNFTGNNNVKNDKATDNGNDSVSSSRRSSAVYEADTTSSSNSVAHDEKMPFGDTGKLAKCFGEENVHDIIETGTRLDAEEIQITAELGINHVERKQKKTKFSAKSTQPLTSKGAPPGFSEDSELVVVELLDGQTGSISFVEHSGGYIATTVPGNGGKDNVVQIWFDKGSIYINGNSASLSSFSLGDSVNFNAKKLMYPDEAEKWQATLVWKGRKPKTSSSCEVSSSNLDTATEIVQCLDEKPVSEDQMSMNSIQQLLLQSQAVTENPVVPNFDYMSQRRMDLILNNPVNRNVLPDTYAGKNGFKELANNSLESTFLQPSARNEDGFEPSNSDLNKDLDLKLTDGTSGNESKEHCLFEDLSPAEAEALEEMINKEIEALVDPDSALKPRRKSLSQSLSSGSSKVEDSSAVEENISACQSSTSSNVTLSEEKMLATKPLVPWDDDAPVDNWIELDDGMDSETLAANESENNADEPCVTSVTPAGQESQPSELVPASVQEKTDASSSVTDSEKPLENELQIPTKDEARFAGLRSLWNSPDLDPTTSSVEVYPAAATSQSSAPQTSSMNSELWGPSPDIDTGETHSGRPPSRIPEQGDDEEAWKEVFTLLSFLRNKTKELTQGAAACPIRSQRSSITDDFNIDSESNPIHAEGSSTLPNAQRPEMANAATQTIFTGEVFCSTIYSGE